MAHQAEILPHQERVTVAWLTHAGMVDVPVPQKWRKVFIPHISENIVEEFKIVPQV